jgi:hypothetical protein
LRIFKRIRETAQNKNTKTPKIKPDDISLLFAETTPKGSLIRHLRVDERGHLIDRCPGGFFEEDFEELF